MPKKKTHKGTLKRAHLTKNGKLGGKIMRRRRVMGGQTKARTNTKRQNRKLVEVKTADLNVIRKLIT